jgi:hypothetical protein
MLQFFLIIFVANIFIQDKSYAKELNENDTCKRFNNELQDIKL